MNPSLTTLAPGALSLATAGAIIGGVPQIALVLCGAAVIASAACWSQRTRVRQLEAELELVRTEAARHQHDAMHHAIGVGEQLCAQFQALDEELTQVRGIIASATDTLSGSLTSLQTASTGQQQLLRDMVDELVSAVRGSEHEEQIREIRRFVEQTEQMIDKLVAAAEDPENAVAPDQQEVFVAMSDHVRAANERVVAKWRTIVEVSDRISSHVHTGIVSLQFEDMAGQLIEHVRRRQSTVEEAFQQLSLALGQYQDPQAFSEALRKVEEEIAQKFHGLSRKSVSQTTVETGSIDLF